MAGFLDNAYADVTVKVVLVGCVGVGKSALVSQFQHGRVPDPPVRTVGVEFGSKVVAHGDRSLKLQLWDLSGDRRFGTVTRSYLRGAHCAVVVFDVANRATFEQVPYWVHLVKAECGSPNLQVVIVGNKADKRADMEVTTLEASKLAVEHEAKFFETCALTGESVDAVFYSCGRAAMEVFDDSEVARAKHDDSTGKSKSSQGCCSRLLRLLPFAA